MLLLPSILPTMWLGSMTVSLGHAEDEVTGMQDVAVLVNSDMLHEILRRSAEIDAA